MLKPSDFDHWRWWLRYQWHEWNPWRLWRKLRHFLANVWAYKAILWHDADSDYVFLLTIMELKLSRMAQHFETHDIVAGSEKLARDCRVAAEICRRIALNDYAYDDSDANERMRKSDLQYLTHLINRRLLCWWD